MKGIHTILTSLALVGAVIACGPMGNKASAQQRGARPGPPAEAFTACEGKSEGDAAEFVSPEGDTVTGTCVMRDGRLVLHPDNPPAQRRRPER